MSMTTLLDIAKMNGSDAVVGLIEEVLNASPEVSMGAARTIKGLNYKTLIRTSLPVAGFRDANEGVSGSKSTYENRLVECFTLNLRWEADKALADRHEDGAAVYVAQEADGILTSSMTLLGKQFYYGASNHAKGFPGLMQSVDAGLVVDATGTTPSTGSSVWAVKFGVKDVQWVWGAGGQLALSDLRIESLRDDDDLPFTGYVQEILAYPGLQVGSKHSVARIKNLTAQATKTLTDSLIAQLLLKFPTGHKPDVLFMSRRSLGQLQASRTATNPSGTPAPFPTEAFNIPIVETDNILDTETIA